MKAFGRPRTEEYWEQPYIQLPIPVPPPWWNDETQSSEYAKETKEDPPRVIIIDIAGEEEV